jgi:hypothetical protein
VRAALALAALLCLAASAHAAGGRYAIVIGNNVGERYEVVLRYAESDARRIAETLRSVGGFYSEDVTVLAGGSNADVRRALIRLNARLREAPAGTLLFVFYSGHADAESLHLGGTRLLLNELRDLTAGSPAETRLLVVDSCRSGALTRVKGGRPAPSFDIRLDDVTPATGLAILTSSAAGEDAQESDGLRASIFTHHFVSALLGAADRDGDGRISIDEAFAYAADRTLASTASTLQGPQHPTYRLELGGRGDLYLTEPGARTHARGALRFAAPGSYVVQSGSADGPIVAELTSDRPGGRLAVEAGRYFVLQRNTEFLRQGTFVVVAGADTAVAVEALRRVEYARVVRKGAVKATRAWSLFALGGVRGELLDLGPAWRTELGARLDLRPVSLELRLGLSGSNQVNERIAIHTWETAASLAGVHVFDLGAVSLGVGVEGGLAWLGQRFSDAETKPRDALAGLLGPLVELEVPLRRRLYARVDGAFLTYLATDQASAGVAPLLSYRFTVGAGAYF